MTRLVMTIVSLLAVVSPLGASAQDAKDSVAAGKNVALIVCSVCHVVAPDQEFAPRLEQRTPSFAEIANRPDVTAESLRKFITTTHWDERTIPITMPNPELIDDQVTEVISYILSLRKHP